MTSTERRPERERILSPAYAATTVGMFALIAFAAFEAMAVTTIMPTVSRELDGARWYAAAFAAPLASAVFGMVAAGLWSDRDSPKAPLLLAMAVFSLGLLVCGTAASMELLVVGRVLQGLGSGALTVALYVMVGLLFPPRLRAAVFASFAAAWVLPSLFGPALAAAIADAWGWRWVFLAVAGLVVVAGFLIAPALRGQSRRLDPGMLAQAPSGRGTGGSGLRPREAPAPVAWTRLLWAAVAAVAVLAVDLLGADGGSRLALAGAALVATLVALRRLVPAGTLRLTRGLPAVVGVRGLLAGSFFCGEAYITYVLQARWDLTPGQAGIALTVVGVVWAASSQAQSRLGERVGDARAITLGAAMLLAGSSLLMLAVAFRPHPAAVVLAYALAGAGMGFAYPRTGVAMLAGSTDDDRGFNSAALSIADSLGAALALSISGVVFALGSRAGVDAFLAVYLFAAAVSALAVVAARRTGAAA